MLFWFSNDPVEYFELLLTAYTVQNTCRHVCEFTDLLFA